MTDAATIPTRFRPPGPAMRWTLRLLALTATVLSVILLYQSLAAGDGLPGCGAGSGCDAVLSSPWSTVGGMPVSLPAAVVYFTLCMLTLHIGPAAPTPRQRWAWIGLLVLSALAALAAVWFVVVQLGFVGEWCRYCMAVHVCGLLLAILIWTRGPVGRRRLLPKEPADPMLVSPIAASGLVVVGLVGVMILALVQLLFPASTTRVDQMAGGETFDTGPGPDRQLTLLNGSIRLAPHEFPMLGSPDAPVVIAELYDYTCPHCRRLHSQLTAAKRRYGDDLAILPLVMPLDGDCNGLVKETDPRHEAACELAALAMAVWRADSAAFELMHDWLFQGDDAPDADAARAYAIDLIGETALDAALAHPWVNTQIQRNIGVYSMTGGSLPQLLTSAAVIRGRPPTVEELYTLLEAETPLQSPR